MGLARGLGLLMFLLLGACARPQATATTQTPDDLDALLRRAASSDFVSYTPRPVMDAVNALVPLGKDGALDAIESFLAHERTTDQHTGLFLVLRVLFDTPTGVHPAMHVGGPSLAPPAEASLLPRFPVALVDDVPIMLVSGYVLGGEPEPVSAHIAFYRAEGVIRATPLAPALTSSERWAELQMVYNRAYGAPPSRAESETLFAQVRSIEP